MAGIISLQQNWNYSPQQCTQFAHYNRFRGSDNYGEKLNTHNDLKYFLAHHRLAIQDLSAAANQPFSDDDNKLHLIFNGEIYNFLEIQQELKNTYYSFKTHSDTEVILKAYQAWGIETCCKKLQGMFAFALVDENKNTIYLARDFLGKKLLYIAQNNNELCFSSDIRSFQHVLSNSKINNNALAYYFTELSTPSDETIYQEIQKLTPGTILQLSINGTQQITFKTVNFITKKISTKTLRAK